MKGVEGHWHSLPRGISGLHALILEAKNSVPALWFEGLRALVAIELVVESAGLLLNLDPIRDTR